MVKMNLMLAVFFHLLFLNYSQAQETAYKLDQVYAVEALKEDLAIMRAHLEKIHPGLYTYISKDALDQQFESLGRGINKPMTELEFYRQMGLLLKDIGDAHSDIEPSDAFYDYLNHQAVVFPFSVFWVNGSLYISRNYSSARDVNLGDQILTINGEKAEDVFFKIREYVHRDGYNLTGPNQTLGGAFSLFRNYYATTFGFPETFELELKTREGEMVRKSIKAETYPVIWERYRAQDGPGVIPPQLLLDIQGDVAVMTIKSFLPQRVKQGGQKFKKFYKQSFAAIKEANVKHLILDLRGNGGGASEAIVQLFGYLYDQPFQFYKELSLITTSIPNHSYFKEERSLPALEKMAQKITAKKGERYILTRGAGIGFTEPQKLPFDGKLYILIDGRSHSATGDFCGVVQQHREVVFLGEETGGNPYQNAAGEALTLVLPHTKLNIIIPTALFIINNERENKGRGIIPDYAIQPSISDLIDKKDVVLEKAMELVGN